jgi:aromatic-L-amino-acid decarboxylase
VTDYRNMSLSLGRRFRSLKVWFTLRSYGVEGFRRHLRRLVELAGVFERAVSGGEVGDGVGLFVPRRFSLVVLRVVTPTQDDAVSNELNQAVVRLASEDHSLMLTPTTVGGRDCVRVAVGSPYTEERHVRELVEKVRGLVERARAKVEGRRRDGVNGSK